MSYFRKEILETTAYQIPREKEGTIKLDQNESPWDIPTELKVRITERLIKTDFNRYAINDAIDLKKRIAKMNRVLPDQVVLSEGSNVMIQALVNAAASRGKVLTTNPCFAVYQKQAEAFGAKFFTVDLYENFTLPVESFLNAIKTHKPNLIFIANPNAPTGNLFDRESLFRIIKAAPCLVVIDEAYYPFSNETLVDWLAEFPNLVILRTFSKAFAMAGVRLGYAIADSDITFQLEKVLMSFRIPATTCAIVDEVLSNTGYVQDYVKKILKERQRMFTQMKMIENITVFASDANFFLFRVADAGRVFKALENKNIIVRNMHNDGPLKGCLRVGVGTPEENDLFLEALKEAVGHSPKPLSANS